MSDYQRAVSVQRTVFVIALLSLNVCLMSSAQELNSRAWWLGVEAGEGQLKLESDQNTGSRGPTFAFGFAGGHRLGNQARVGVEVNGWLLEASNFNDPTVGENVSNVMGIFDVFPVRRIPLFLRGGAGLAMYSNNHPTGTGGTGFAWNVGAGYEIPLKGNVGLAPMVDYAAGGFGDVKNPLTVETGRRYSVVEFKAAIIFHFGSSK